MNRMLESILIVSKAGLPSASALVGDIRQWLEQRGAKVRHCENGPDDAPQLSVPDDVGCILVLGGDGTFLGVARRTLRKGIPLLGVNLGKVGFLAEIEVADWQHQLERVFAGEFSLVDRFALSCRVERDGETVFTGDAVNDLVIHRGALARVITLNLVVSGERVGGLRADGLIVSTPSGATGYAVSARGPLLHPDLDVYSITPICPFLNNFLPLVLGGDKVFVAEICEADTDVYLTQDGQEGVPLQTGDRVYIHRAANGLPMIRLSGSSYFDKLRGRGFIKDQTENF